MEMGAFVTPEELNDNPRNCGDGHDS